MKMKFLKCKVCGQVIAMVNETGAPIICCGEAMTEIEPKTLAQEFKEKHVPTYVIGKNKITVTIGSIPHPMTEDHYIEWIALVTNKGNQRKKLKPGDAPTTSFCLDDDEIVEDIYAYCNIHSLWTLTVREDDFFNKRKCNAISKNTGKKK